MNQIKQVEVCACGQVSAFAPVVREACPACRVDPEDGMAMTGSLMLAAAILFPAMTVGAAFLTAVFQ